MRKTLFFFFTILISFAASAQPAAVRISPQQYIERFKEIAIEEMHRSGIPASITLAQGILETESGNSELVRKSNNHFGIKCKKSWRGESVTHTDDAPDECFRKYDNAYDSYRDHSDYLKTSARYASLFELEKSDYKGWAKGLKRAGYATNPRYPDILISNIERYQLFIYDAIERPLIPADMAEGNKDHNREVAVAETKAYVAKTDPPLAVAQPVYAPELVTKFNGRKAVFVQKGRSLLAVATGANIPLLKLLEFNNLEKDGLLAESQFLYLERSK